jgi:hypothetical protein
MDFVSSQYNKTIPSKSTFVPSDNQLDYGDGQTVRFEIPSFMGFIDPRQTYLKMKVQVLNSPAVVRLSNKCGSHSLIDQLRIYDNQNTQLETIQNYSELAETLHHYTENRTIRNKRGITEAVEYTSRDYDGEIYDNFPSRNADNSLFYDAYQTSATVDTTNAGRMNGVANGVIGNSNEVEVAMRLYSGILGEPNNKMFPAMLTDGLRVELDLNSAEKAFECWSFAGVCNDDGTPMAGKTESCRFGIVEADLGGGGNPIKVKLQMEINAGFNQILQDTAGGALNGGITAGAFDSGCRLVKKQLVGALNMLVGKELVAYDNTGVAGGANPTLQDLGVITAVSCNNTEDGGGLATVDITCSNPNNVGANAFVGGVGRVAAGTAGNDLNNQCFIKQSDFFNSKPTLKIKDVELVVKTAQPPSSYIDALLKGTQTEEGATYDYYTWNVYRNNLTANESVAQLNIPALNMRATSALVKPMENGLVESVLNNNLASVVDNVKDYAFLIANKQQPTQKVSLANLSHLSPTNESEPLVEQVALFETEKALGSSKMAVKNLDHQADNFVIGRALARYGGVYPLIKDGGFQLRVDYKNAPQQPQKNKLFITYVGGLRRLSVGKNGVQVQV